jgi:hypothetical protein
LVEHGEGPKPPSANQAVVNEIDGTSLICRHRSLTDYAQMAQPLAPPRFAQWPILLHDTAARRVCGWRANPRGAALDTAANSPSGVALRPTTAAIAAIGDCDLPPAPAGTRGA